MSDHPLTREQAWFAARCFREWLRIKEAHEPGSGGRIEEVAPRNEWGSMTYRRVETEPRWKPGDLTFLGADIDHSALLHRLLIGKPALPEPPPIRHSYPVYPE